MYEFAAFENHAGIHSNIISKLKEAFMRRILATLFSLFFVVVGMAGPSHAAPANLAVAVTTLNDVAEPTCPSPNNCSLRGAVLMAAGSPNSNSLVNIPAGEYVLTRGAIEFSNQNSIITINGAGTSTIIKQCSITTITCESEKENERAFNISYSGNSDDMVIFSNLRVTSFTISPEDGSYGFGGAVINAQYGAGGIKLSAIRFDHNSVVGNDISGGGTGGGAVRSTSRIYVKDSQIDHNSVTTLASRLKGANGGAALYVNSSVEIVDSSVTDNSSNIGASKGLAGGAVQVMSQNISVIRSTISRNNLIVGMPSEALNAFTLDDNNDNDPLGNNGGAAIYQDGQDINIIDSTLDSNQFTLNANADLVSRTLLGANGGGAIYQYGNTTTITNSTLSNNTARLPSAVKGYDSLYAVNSIMNRSGGGAIFENGDSALYTNATIVGNKIEPSDSEGSLVDPENGGGAIFFDGERSRIAINNSTIVSNEAVTTRGGAIMVHDTGNGQTAVHVSDSIIGLNTASVSASNNCTVQNNKSGGDVDYFQGAVISEGYNLTSDASCGFSATGDIVTSSLGLSALADNGGPTKTVAITSSSAAHNHGNPSGCATALGNRLYSDQRGQARTQGVRCDIGAFEFTEEIPAVTTPAVVAKKCYTGSIGSVLFAPNSATLTKVAKANLSGYAKVIASTNCGRIVLRGYTAKFNPADSEEKARATLAANRTNVVNKYLALKLKKLGVTVKFSKVTRGSKNPVGTNRNEAGRTINRRVEIELRAK